MSLGARCKRGGRTRRVTRAAASRVSDIRPGPHDQNLSRTAPWKFSAKLPTGRYNFRNAGKPMIDGTDANTTTITQCAVPVR